MGLRASLASVKPSLIRYRWVGPHLQGYHLKNRPQAPVRRGRLNARRRSHTTPGRCVTGPQPVSSSSSVYGTQTTQNRAVLCCAVLWPRAWPTKEAGYTARGHMNATHTGRKCLIAEYSMIRRSNLPHDKAAKGPSLSRATHKPARRKGYLSHKPPTHRIHRNQRSAEGNQQRSDKPPAAPLATANPSRRR
ncbi:hypothetical protein OIDMADRAFT_22123 [Oidiodendron maius Zn]|uniref:Uncharacterized protein n=1 Tax=Oidiodendron maius (strain Zn) TaxID=913774 RepID=A0A0C3HYC6_OIDMZ|nr:hypothetical protein OIDMADRAFT_22123 [Oidiodendron maius Zn]